MHPLTQAFKSASDVHPSLVDWFENNVLANPTIATWLAVAVIIMVWHLERPHADPHAAYQRYQTTFEMITDNPAPHEFDERTFSKLMISLQKDEGVAKVLLKEPLIVEHGDVGRVRRKLWADGLREPYVSRVLMATGGLAKSIR